MFYDRAAVDAAFEAGEGETIQLTLNSNEPSPFSEKLDVEARIDKLSQGVFIGEYGMVAGKTVDTGRTAVVSVNGIQIVIISKRQQCLSVDFLSAFGIDPNSCRVIVVKSRGHFRAGFKHIFEPSQINEIDVPGLTSPNLATFEWQYLPRPVFPLDEVTWSRNDAE